LHGGQLVRQPAVANASARGPLKGKDALKAPTRLIANFDDLYRDSSAMLTVLPGNSDSTEKGADDPPH
jgi:hypothetical protein